MPPTFATLKPPRNPTPAPTLHPKRCISYYTRIIDAALAAAGAPPGLVSFVTGYGDAGAALVTGGVDKVRCRLWL
jgi:hypothetical protein